MTGDTHVAGMTDAELDKLRTDCYAEGRKDEREAIAESGYVTDDMRAAVRYAPHSAHWSRVLVELFGPDARDGINSLEQQLHRQYNALENIRRLLGPVYEEVAGKAPPTDPNSYLPPEIVGKLAEAIRFATEKTA